VVKRKSVAANLNFKWTVPVTFARMFLSRPQIPPFFSHSQLSAHEVHEEDVMASETTSSRYSNLASLSEAELEELSRKAFFKPVTLQRWGVPQEQSRRPSKVSVGMKDDVTPSTTPHMDIASGTKKPSQKSSKPINTMSPAFIFFCVCFALSALINVIFVAALLREPTVSSRLDVVMRPDVVGVTFEWRWGRPI